MTLKTFFVALHGTENSIFQSNLVNPSKSNEIGHVAIRDNMHLEMEIRIKSFPEEGMENVFQCGTTAQERYPGIWIGENAAMGFYVQFSDHDDSDRGTNTGDVTTNTWYHLEMDITETRMRVTVDNVVKYDESKSVHNTYDDMECYFSNPWDNAANVDVRELQYYPVAGLCRLHFWKTFSYR